MENVKAILTESIFEVFERMFFIFLEPGGRAPVHDCEAAIRFDGQVIRKDGLFLPKPLQKLNPAYLLGKAK